jgi:hypothetical protein
MSKALDERVYQKKIPSSFNALLTRIVWSTVRHVLQQSQFFQSLTQLVFYDAVWFHILYHLNWSCKGTHICARQGCESASILSCGFRSGWDWHELSKICKEYATQYLFIRLTCNGWRFWNFIHFWPLFPIPDLNSVHDEDLGGPQVPRTYFTKQM